MSKMVPLYGFGGGSPLNFQFKRYETEDELIASTPSNGTIGIVSSTPISGYYFGSEPPLTDSDGILWLCTGTKSNVAFSATKFEQVMVYPLYAEQYINGAFVEVPAYSRQWGSWVRWWNGQIYTSGHEWNDITGGWVGVGMKAHSGTSLTTQIPNIFNDVGSGMLTISNESGSGVAYCANQIDVSDYSKIVFEGDFHRIGSVTTNLLVGCWENFEGTYFSKSAKKYTDMPATTATSLELDVSSLSGCYYIGVGTSGSTAVITNIYMK